MRLLVRLLVLVLVRGNSAMENGGSGLGGVVWWVNDCVINLLLLKW
jgi:hypothetical protein